MGSESENELSFEVEINSFFFDFVNINIYERMLKNEKLISSSYNVLWSVL